MPMAIRTAWSTPASNAVLTGPAVAHAARRAAFTGGGTLLPMSDVIRMAGHACHYLAIIDRGKAIGLYHTTRRRC
jgi:Domain of unknown function (DUF222)